MLAATNIKNLQLMYLSDVYKLVMNWIQIESMKLRNRRFKVILKSQLKAVTTVDSIRFNRSQCARTCFILAVSQFNHYRHYENSAVKWDLSHKEESKFPPLHKIEADMNKIEADTNKIEAEKNSCRKSKVKEVLKKTEVTSQYYVKIRA
jgi:RecA-family ATPase